MLDLQEYLIEWSVYEIPQKKRNELTNKMKLIGELRQLVKAGDKVASVKSMENSVGDENDPTAILLKSLKHYQTSLVKGNIEVDLIEAEKILQGQLNRAKFRVEHDSKEIE